MGNLFPFNPKLFELESSRLLLGLNKSFEKFNLWLTANLHIIKTR